ncbi:MAG: tetratricopeptide repeat protein [Deltaproteobacteria bacterium]|nr:MAG: tetratricopeptide repeat protein [Deltaproteobacteria bacterium]
MTAAPSGARPPGLSASESLVWEAGAAIDAGDLAGGEMKARAALAHDSKSVGAHVQLGRIALMRGDYATAQREANVALAAEPRNTAALYLILRTQDAQGTVQQSVSRLRDLANTYRDDLGVQLAYGEVQLLTDKADGAIAAVGRVLKKAETSVAAMKLLARAYLALNRPMTAEYVLLRAIELERDPEALTLLAGIRFREGKVVEARVLLEEAVQKAPGYLEALNSLGCVYIEVRNYEAAEEVLQRAVAIAPGFVEGWLDLGSAQRGAGRFEAAEASWKKTLDLDKKRVEAWFDLGVLYLENPLPGRDRVKQLEDALNAFNGYKAGAGKAADPNADKYIGEARLLRKQEEERRKEQLKTPPAPAGDAEGEPAG